MACPCENNNTTPSVPCTGQNTCIEVVSSDCISYVGVEKKCGTDVVYENGDSLSTVQSKIVDYICDKIQPGPSGFTHYIGESYGGGVVFHVYKDTLGVEHGLVVSIDYQSTSSTYSNITNVLNGAGSYYNGESNTNLMKVQSGAISGAWKLCDDYIYGGYSDWYLPAIDELVLLWNNRLDVNRTLENLSFTMIQTNTCWSSTEQSIYSGWYSYFSDRVLVPQGASKNDLHHVRAIRQF